MADPRRDIYADVLDISGTKKPVDPMEIMPQEPSNEILDLLRKRKENNMKESAMALIAGGIGEALSGDTGGSIAKFGNELSMNRLQRGENAEDSMEKYGMATNVAMSKLKAEKTKPMTKANVLETIGPDGKPIYSRVEDALGQSVPTDQADTKEGDFKRYSAEDRLLGSFRNEKIIKDTDLMSSAYQGILSAPDNAVGDMGTIFQVQKILDPGSVTRDSEFRNLGNAGRLDERVQTMYDRLLAGERMTKTVRDNYKDLVQRKMQAQMKLAKSKSSGYVKTAKERGFKNVDQFSVGTAGSKDIMSSFDLKIGTIDEGHRYTGGDPSDKNNWEKIR